MLRRKRSNTTPKLILFVITLCIITIQSSAQVTIGSATPPCTGALLDLKDKTSKLEGNATAVKGLGLPRVKLTNLKPKTATELAKSIGNTSGAEYDLLTHVGLLVYSAFPNDCSGIAKGLYVWSGTKWDPLDEVVRDPSVKVWIDPRDNNQYLYRDFGGTAGTWMLENICYIDPSFTAEFKSGISDNDRFYGYPQKFYGAETDPEKIPSWQKSYGLLYTFAAATMGGKDGRNDDSGNSPTEAITDPIQGVCPPGWRVPTDYEWSQLEEEMAKHPEKYSTSTTPSDWNTNGEDFYSQTGYRPKDIRGHEIAMTSPCNLMYQYDFGKSYPARFGGLSVMLVGTATASQGSGNYGSHSAFWTSSQNSRGTAWSRGIELSDNVIYHGVERIPYYSKTNYFSVRCKK